MNIYLDYNATTPIDEEVQKAMLPYLTKYYGNPSSSYSSGRLAAQAIEDARKQVADLIHCSSNEISFVSGATESINFAIKGTALREFRLSNGKRNHIITSCIEHIAVLKTCAYLETQGFQVSYLNVDEYGQVNPNDVFNAIKKETILVSIMHSNNEVGTLQPILEIAQLIEKAQTKNKIFFHTDASQSIGKVSVDVSLLAVDMLTIAGHKVYAPKGIGALYIRNGTPSPDILIHGGNQEKGLRAGTENVLLCVGLGKACQVVQKQTIEQISQNMKRLRDSLLKKFQEAKNLSFVVNGHPLQHLPNTLSISFQNIDALELLNRLEGKVNASCGSACHSKKEENEFSYVLKAMNISDNLCNGTIRFSVGKDTTEEEITQAAKYILEACAYQQTQEENKLQIKETKRLYYQDAYMFEASGNVVSVKSDLLPTKKSQCHNIILNQTIFHPQGGGQPSDIGRIQSEENPCKVFNVETVRSDIESGIISHYGTYEDETKPFDIGEKIKMIIDSKKRLLHARLHSAAHVIDKAMHNLNLSFPASKGYHFPDSPFVEYSGKLSDKKQTVEEYGILSDKLKEECNRLIKEDILTIIQSVDLKEAKELIGNLHNLNHLPSDKPIRLVQVANCCCPCGGTHVKKTSTIGRIKINKIKEAKGKIKISYDLENTE